MARYIDADALIAQFEDDEKHLEDFAFKCACLGAINTVKKQPTADVVEVVRCKDCKYRRKTRWADGTDNWECVNDAADPYDQSRNAEDDDWFCADGEAKDG